MVRENRSTGNTVESGHEPALGQAARRRRGSATSQRTAISGVAPIGAPTLTLSITPPAVTLQAPPPALISPDVGADYVGMTRAALVDVLAAMRRDPDFADRVIVLSRKRTAAAPEDVIAFLRARYTAKASPTVCETQEAPSANDTASSGVDDVLELVGAERVSARGGERGAR